MRRFTVLIDGTHKTITLNRLLVTGGCTRYTPTREEEWPTIMVKRATIFWDYDNIDPKLGNNEFELKGTKSRLEPGYFTYESLTDYMNKVGVTEERYAWTNKCGIRSQITMKLGKMGLLLGLGEVLVIGDSLGIG